MEKYKKFLLARGPEILKVAQLRFVTKTLTISKITLSIIETFPDKSSIKYLQLAQYGKL